MPEKAKGGKYVLGTLKMQRTTLVKAYLKWLDARAQEENGSSHKQKQQQAKKSSGGAKKTASAKAVALETEVKAETREAEVETEVEPDQRLNLLSAVIGDDAIHAGAD